MAQLVRLIEGLPLRTVPPNLKIGSLIDRGAYGTVHEGELDGESVAVKNIHVELKDAEGGDNAVRSFFDECERLRTINHDHVIRFRGAFKDPKLGPILVMERMKENLKRFLETQRGKLNLPEQIRISHEITQGVAFLHQQTPPMVHRDLNDKNVMFTFDGVVKIGDFGQSKLKTGFYLKTTAPGMVSFMPPEALRHGYAKYDESLDVFSLGVLMLSIGTQHPPNSDVYGIGVIPEDKRRAKDLERMSDSHPMEPFILLCLSEDPEKRPKAVELVIELSKLKENMVHTAVLAAEQRFCEVENGTHNRRLPSPAEASKDTEQANHAHQEMREMKEPLDCIVAEELQREKEVGRSYKAEAEEPQVMHLLRKLGKCQKVIQHRPGGGGYGGVAVNSEGLLAVTDDDHECVHLLNNEGLLVRSIGERQLDDVLSDVAFDLKGNIWVTDHKSSIAIKLSQDGQLEQTIRYASSDSDCLSSPFGITVSPEGLIYICDSGNHRVTVHDEEGKFQFAFGSKGSDLWCFNQPRGVACGSDGLVYVTDQANERVSVWSKQGTFVRCFKTEHRPYFVAATSNNHLLVTSRNSDVVMVYTLEGLSVHQFGGRGNAEGKFREPQGICIGNNGLVYVGDCNKKRIQVFASVM